MNPDFVGDPLLNEGLARYHPDGNVIEFALTRDQVIAMSDGGQLESSLRAAAKSTPVAEIFGGVPDEVKHFFAAIKHEHDHLRRYLGTSFGIFQGVLRRSLSKTFAKLVDAALEADVFPLFPIVSSRLEERALSLYQHGRERTSLAEAAREWIGIEALSKALATDVGTENFHVIDSALETLFRHSGTSYKPSTALEGWGPGGRSSHPVNLKGQALGLTAHHLLEFFALCEEGNAFLQLGVANLERIDELLNEVSRDYSLLTLLWGTGEDFRRFSPPLDQPREQSELNVYFRLWPIQLYAIADLALWIPIGPSGVRCDGASWMDVNPGHRFVLAKRILAGKGPIAWEPIPADSVARSEAINTLQGEICNQRGWPTPCELAQEWLDSAELLELDPGSQMLLKLRLERPGDAILNNLDFQRLGAPRANVWLTASSDDHISVELFEVGREAEAEQAVRRFLLHAAMRFLVGGFSCSPVLMGLDAKLRQKAVDTVVDTYEQKGGRDPAALRRAATSALLSDVSSP